MDGAVQLAGRQRLDRIAAGNSQPRGGDTPSRRPGPPVAQQLEQLRRQHGVAILATLALLDPQQHALGVDIAGLERDDLETRSPAP